VSTCQQNALTHELSAKIVFFRTRRGADGSAVLDPKASSTPPPRVPLLDVATRTSFLVLAEEPDSEIVLGTLVAAPREVATQWQADSRWLQGTVCDYQHPGLRLGHDELSH
jgi:hypothetical protein